MKKIVYFYLGINLILGLHSMINATLFEPGIDVDPATVPQKYAKIPEKPGAMRYKSIFEPGPIVAQTTGEETSSAKQASQAKTNEKYRRRMEELRKKRNKTG